MHFGKSLSEDSSMRQRGNLIFKSLHIFTLNIQLNMKSINNVMKKKLKNHLMKNQESFKDAPTIKVHVF